MDRKMDIGMTSMPATTTGLQLLFEHARGGFDDRFNRSTGHLGNLASSFSRSYHYRLSHITSNTDDRTSSFGSTNSDRGDCFCAIRKDAHDIAPRCGEMDRRVRMFTLASCLHPTEQKSNDPYALPGIFYIRMIMRNTKSADNRSTAGAHTARLSIRRLPSV
jgi:hypothetical protein